MKGKAWFGDRLNKGTKKTLSDLKGKGNLGIVLDYVIIETKREAKMGKRRKLQKDRI